MCSSFFLVFFHWYKMCTYKKSFIKWNVRNLVCEDPTSNLVNIFLIKYLHNSFYIVIVKIKKHIKYTHISIIHLVFR